MLFGLVEMFKAFCVIVVCLGCFVFGVRVVWDYITDVLFGYETADFMAIMLGCASLVFSICTFLTCVLYW